MRLAIVLPLLVAIVASSCEPIGDDKPVISLPTLPSPKPTISGALTLRPEQVILPDAEFPLSGYSVDKDERLGTSGWTRNWRGSDAFSWVRVSVTVLDPSMNSRNSIAAATCDWTFTPFPALSAAEITAPVVGDGAKACGYDFKDLPVGSLVYTTGTRNVVVTVGVYRRSTSQAAAAAFAASLADYQLWIIDKVAPLSGLALRATPRIQVPGASAVVTPPPTPRTSPPTPTVTPRPTATPIVVTPTPSAGPTVAVQNVPCGTRLESTVTTAALPLTITYVCYDVSGSTGAAVLASVNTRSPVDSTGNPAGYTSIALTDSRYQHFVVQYSDQGGTCRAASVTGTFSITFTYPRWVPPASPDPVLVAKWNTWIAGVQTHENGHKDRSINWFNDVVTRVLAISVANCADFNAASTAAQDQAQALNAKAQAEYEAITNHGLTQRSGLP